MSLTLQEFLQQATAELRHHSPTARLDGEVLAMHVCGLTRAQLITRADDILSPSQLQTLQDLLARRSTGEPVAYLTGEREFWSMPLRVTRATLIPRPDTEILVEQALARIPQEATWRIADLGTGSGAIALAIAQERPHCHLIATDLSATALAIAQDNAHRLGINNIEFRLGSWAAPLQNERLEMIVSNPPYVRRDDPHLHQGDVRYEPFNALIGGDDGLQAIREITGLVAPLLKPSGWLLLEHGHDQAGETMMILLKNGFSGCLCYKDLTQYDRITVGQWSGDNPSIHLPVRPLPWQM